MDSIDNIIVGINFGDNHAVDFVGFERVGDIVLACPRSRGAFILIINTFPRYRKTFNTMKKRRHNRWMVFVVLDVLQIWENDDVCVVNNKLQ